MRAALLDEPGRPLRVAEVAEPSPDPGQLLLRVEACGVCRTDLHLRDGEAMQPGPEPLDAALIFAPVGALVPAALRATAPGGTVVCAGIHMSDIPSFPYADLWEERVLRSVANLTRADAEEFLALAPQVPVRTTVTPFSIGEAEDALSRLRAGAIEGAAVVLPAS